MVRRHQLMQVGPLIAFVLVGLLGGPLAAQEARVRVVDKVAMPTAVDSNSPAFWRDGRLQWFGSHGRPWLSEGKDQFGPWSTREINVEGANPWPLWMESVWAEESGVLWGWYHTEPVNLIEDSTLTAPKIGAVVSYDGGKTLRDLGIVLESGDPLDPSARNGYFAGGHGDFSVIPDRGKNYFYFLFDNYGGPVETQGVAIARMAFEDRFNPVGRVWKYHNGTWQEPGRGGRVTPIFPVRRGWQLKDPDAFWGPSIHWNTHLNCYVMLLNRAAGEPGWAQEGIYVSFCSDLSRPESWTPPTKILDKSQFPGWYYFYPQVMGLEPGGTDTRAGATARLYVNGASSWEIDFIPKPAVPSDLKLETSPVSGAIGVGAPASFSVVATGTAPFTYQWLRNGAAIPGATAANYAIPTVSVSDAGSYTVVVSNALGSTASNVAILSVAELPSVPSTPVSPVPEPAAFISSLSFRSSLVSRRSVISVGYGVETTLTKRLMLRAIGPSLSQFGISGGVPDPRLEVYNVLSELTAENDDWLPEQANLFSSLGAFPLPPASADACVVVDVPSGPGTARIRGNSEGIVLIEIFDLSPSRSAKIVNVSARSMVGSSENVLIGGFAVGGSGSKRLGFRAVGQPRDDADPTEVPADPMLELYDSGGVKVAENDDWDAALEPVFAAAGAPALVVGGPDAAFVVTLAAGNSYSAVVHNREGREGDVRLEIYELP